MLLSRSIWVQASLLIFALTAECQRYDAEYEVSDGDEGDHQSSYTEGSDKPDYSSYYKNDASAPLITSQGEGSPAGFNPVEFSNFFTSPHFDFGGSSSNTKEVHKPIPLVEQTKAAANGFVSPQNFQQGFGFENVSPFGQDYFEQSAQKQQQQKQQEELNDHAETKPGPNYISYRVPASQAKEQLKSYATEVHDLNSEPEYESFRRESFEDDDDKENLEDDKEELNEEEEEEDDKKPIKKPASIDYNLNLDYGLPEFGEKKEAEKSEKVEVTPQNSPFLPNYYTKYTDVKPTPYQKYSFQPVADPFGGALVNQFAELQSTVTPFNPSYKKVADESKVNAKYETQPTETNAKSTGGKKCKKINKDITEKDIRTGRFKRQAMNCYVCEDPKNGANYEQCSYSSEPNEQSYFVGKAEKYSKPAKVENFRYKRYTDKQEEEQEEEDKGEYVNPYDYVKKKSHKYYSRPDEFTESYYNPKDFGPVEEYRFPQEYFDEEKEDKEKSESEIQSEKLVKDGENCKKVKKEGVTCMVCKNPKTGGNYEQCSYTSAPAEKKYAYVRERKFDENENPIEDKVVESTEPEKVVERKPHRSRARSSKVSRPAERSSAEESSREAPSKRRGSSKQSAKKTKPQSRRRFNSEEREDAEESKKREVENSSYEFPTHFVESTTKREKAGLRGLDPELFGSADSRESKEKKDKRPFEKEIEDYHYSLYPKHNEQSESKNEEKRVKPAQRQPYEYEDDSKKDVEAVLAEFAKKDRSNCKKAHKNGMTCYLCVDKNGIKNEECMFVSESQPKSTHVAYHEVKKVKSPEEEDSYRKEEEEAESKQKEVLKPKEDFQKKRKPVKKFTTPKPVDVGAEPSRVSRTTTEIPPTSRQVRVPRKLKRDKNVPRDVLVEESKRRERKVKPEKAQPDEDGYIALETSPVFSKSHGIILPKYMAEISNYEKTFDVDRKPQH